MEKDYKVEMKPTIWHITIWRGEYSDHEERHYFISANDDNEAWEFFKRYMKDIKEDEIFVWNKERFKIGEGTSWFWRWDVNIKRLNVIYFKR